jgi:hypothetical protein
MAKRDKLQVMLCVPGPHMPASERFIVARVFDGKRNYFFQFGRDWSINHVWEMVPRLYMDSKFKPRARKAVS